MQNEDLKILSGFFKFLIYINVALLERELGLLAQQ